MKHVLLLTALFLCGTAHAAAPQEDPVTLAQIMVRDGHWDRARQVLTGMDAQNPKLDHGKRLATWGLLHLHDKSFPKAIEAFTGAIDIGLAEDSADPVLYIYLAQAFVFNNQPQQALNALGNAGSAADHMVQSYMIRFRAYQELNKPDQAWTALTEGIVAFPNNRGLQKQRLVFMIETQLVEVSYRASIAFLAVPEATEDDALDLAALFRQQGLLAAAQLILEASVLRFGDTQALLIASAAVALEDKRHFDAGRFLERATQRAPKYAIESAEAYRKSGDIQKALYMNAQAVDSLDKTRQRFGLYIESKQYTRAISMQARLKRLGLLKDDSVKYGLAYCFFHASDPVQAEQYLETISDKKIFQQAIALREAMAACEQDICW